MALISCPECGHEISDTAKTCINCGYKMNNHKLGSKKIVTVISCVLIAVVVIGFIASQIQRARRDEELRLRSIDNAIEQADELYALSSSYLELGRAVENGTGSTADFLAIQYKLLDHLKLSHDMADLTGVNDEIIEAVEAQMERYRDIATKDK